MIMRIIFGVIIILAAFLTPWWVSLILALFGLFYFDKLYEVVFVGLIIDSLYGSSSFFFDIPYPLTITMLVVFYLAEKFKKQLMIYK